MAHSFLQWMKDYQLFLFDFDGLLVNTEQVHFEAYKQMCLRRGFVLDWDYSKFCFAAHFESMGLRDQIYAQFPRLYEIEPLWEVLYAEKKQIYLELLKKNVQLMPGVEEILLFLKEADLKSCVVTNSPSEQIEVIRRQNPLLNVIRNWMTREQYHLPKPHPESYLKAIEMYAKKEDRIIGFEDSPKGLQALLGTRAQPVMVCSFKHPFFEKSLNPKVIFIENFNQVRVNSSLS